PVTLSLRILCRTVVLAHIDDRLLSELVGMPALIKPFPTRRSSDLIRYPDGRHYLKIGISSTADPELRSVPDLIGWFKSAGSADNRRDFQAFVTRLIPALDRGQHWHTDTFSEDWSAVLCLDAAVFGIPRPA